MRRTIPSSTFVLAIFLASSVAVSAEVETRSYPLPNQGSLQLKVPTSWLNKVSQPPNDLPPTILFLPQSGPSFQVLLTPFWPARPGVVLPGPTELKKSVEENAERLKPLSVEKELIVKEIRGASSYGYYVTSTDKAPKPNEYKYMSQGMHRVGDLLITFTVLTNDGMDAVHKDTIAALESALHNRAMVPRSGQSAVQPRPDAIQIIQRESDFLLTVPVSRLSMTFPRLGFIQQSVPAIGSAANPRYFAFQDTGSNMILSGWFEPAERYEGIDKIWASDTANWKNAGLSEPRNVSFTKITNWEAVFYEHDSLEGINAHVKAHWVQAGTWIDVHLSTTSRETSQALRGKLELLLKQIVITLKN